MNVVTSTEANQPSLTPEEYTDSVVRDHLDSLATDPNYWDFRRGATRDAIHGVTQYPAMMVPAMQGKLFDILCEVTGRNTRIVDPFVGSGTTLVEAMRRGLNFWGQDINPLAVLISLTKTGPFNVPELERAVTRVHNTAQLDTQTAIIVDFPGRDKWFDTTVAISLSRLRKAIQNEQNIWVRRMLWVTLAETVRLTSNSRTSTFKLHVRSQNELAARKVDTVAQFLEIASSAVRRVCDECAVLERMGYLRDHRYTGTSHIQIGRSDLSLPGNEPFDLLVTSPPYGDGTSTVPYGQYSFLPLQWIDLADITPDIDETVLRSTHEIDFRSLGGSRRRALDRVKFIRELSPSLDRYLKSLAGLPHECMAKVAAFFADFEPVLDTIVSRMRPGGYMVWTVGNRRVGGMMQPLDDILAELLKSKRCSVVSELERTIPSKRMANRNCTTQTMREEQVLIMRVTN